MGSAGVFEEGKHFSVPEFSLLCIRVELIEMFYVNNCNFWCSLSAM
jgi:hypothetical protein